MTEPGENDKEEHRVMKSAIAALEEHFDTVQIFCTRFDQKSNGATRIAVNGSGNWYARFGSVVEWVEQQKEEFRIDQRKYGESDNQNN